MNSSQDPTDPKLLTSSQVARSLGVSQTTVKRWIDSGLLPAHRTKGGHRRIHPADLWQLIDRGTIPHLDAAAVRLSLSSTPSSEDCAGPHQQFKQVLIDGDRSGADRIITEAFRTGGMQRVAEGLVAPAMTQIGLDWQTGKIDVMHEHRATEICTSVLYKLVPLVERSIGQHARVAVGCAPTHDYHQIAGLLAQLLLAEAGWQAKSLGGGVSAAQLESAAAQHQAEVVWISVTNIPSIEDFIKEFAPAIKRMKKSNIIVLFGGQGLDQKTASKAGFSQLGDRVTDIVRLAGNPARS